MVKKTPKKQAEDNARHEKLGPQIQRAWVELRKAIDFRKRVWRETPFDSEATFKAAVAEEQALENLHQLENLYIYGEEKPIPRPKLVPDRSI